jgi:hypothetical protein
MITANGPGLSAADSFSFLAASWRLAIASLRASKMNATEPDRDRCKNKPWG